MNTWRNENTAPLDTVILATDGTAVMAGVVRDLKEGDYLFTGFDLGDGKGIAIMRSKLTGWQPAPDTWKQPEKPADEMFAELGAKRCPLIKNPFSGRRAYKRMDRYSEYRYEFTGDAVFAYVNGVQCGITIEEIPAIAQTLKELQQELREMEADNG